MSPLAAPRLSILIPCYNEQARVGQTIAAVTSYLAGLPYASELVLIDDGSSDSTWPILQSAVSAGPVPVRALHQPVNGGKGRALAAGVNGAAGEVVLFFDADLSYPLDHVAEAVDAIMAGSDVVAGARDLGAGRSGYSLFRKLASGTLNAIVDGVLDLDVPDTQCGFKAFRREVAQALFQALTIGRFGFDIELLYLVRRWGLRLHRLPVTMTHRAGSTVRVIPDSLRMLRDIAHIRRHRKRYPARPAGV